MKKKMNNEEMNYLTEILTCLEQTYKTSDKETRKLAEKKLKEAEGTILMHLPFILETIKGNSLSKELSGSLIIYIRNTIISKRKDNQFNKETIIELIKTLVNTIISAEYPDSCLREINKCFEEIINCSILEEDSSIIFELMTLFQNRLKQNNISIISYKGIAYIFENILCASCVNSLNSSNIIIIELDCSEFMLEKVINVLESIQLNSENQTQISYYLDTLKVIYELLLNISVHSRKTYKNIEKFLPVLNTTFQNYALKLLGINYEDKSDSKIKMNTKIFRYFISLLPKMPEYLNDTGLLDFHSNAIMFSLKTLENKTIIEKINSNSFIETYATQVLNYLTKICFKNSFIGDFQKYLGEFTKKIVFPLLVSNENDKIDILNDEEGTNYANYIYDIVTTRKGKGIKVSLAKFIYQGSKKSENYLKFVIEYAITLIIYGINENDQNGHVNDFLVVNASQEQRIETSLLVLCVISALTKNSPELTSIILNFVQKHFLFLIEREKESNIIKERFCLFISIYVEKFLLCKDIDTAFYSNLCEFLLFNLFNTNKPVAKYESAEAIKIILLNNNFKDNFSSLSNKYITQFILYTKEAKSPIYFDILAELFSSLTSEENALDLVKILFARVLTEISPRRLSHSGKNEIQMERMLSSQYREIINKCFYVIRAIFSKNQFIIKYYKEIEEMLSPLLVYMKYPYKIDFDDDIIIIMTMMIKTLNGVSNSALKLLPDIPQYLRKNKGLLLDLYELLNEYIIYSNNVIESNEDNCRILFKLFKKSFTKESNYDKSPFLGCCLMQIWIMHSKTIPQQIVIDIIVFTLEQLDKLFKKESTLSIKEQNLFVALTTLICCSFINYHVLSCNNINFDLLIRYLECINDFTIYSNYEIKLLLIGICALLQNPDIINNFPKIICHFLSFTLHLLKKQKQYEAKALKKKNYDQISSGLNNSENEDESRGNMEEEQEQDLSSSMHIEEIPINEEDEYIEIGNRSINPYKTLDEFQLYKESLKRLQEGISYQMYHSWFDELWDSDKAALNDILNTSRIVIETSGNINNKSPHVIEIPRKIVKVKKH